MAHIVRTERGTRAFETSAEAEEFGRLQYVRGGTPAYTIVRDDRVEPNSILRNEVVVPYRPKLRKTTNRVAKRTNVSKQ